MRVLVLGGTGVFGSRLCRLLADDPKIALTIAARDGAAVERLAGRLRSAGRAFDWRRDLDRVLGEGGHDAVVHVAGPFQGQDYTVAELCIRHGVHYVDLADDAAFVGGIERLNDAATTAGLLVCAGASTAPALTGAVVGEALRSQAIERVAFAIVPGNDAPRGRALIHAILSRVGRPIADQPGRHGWGSLRRVRMPGLGKRWVAACDLPEPGLFARRFGIRETYAGAGLELGILHLGVWVMGWLVRARLVRTLTPAAPVLATIAGGLRGLGSDRGGLRIDLHGPSDRRVWCLLAEGGDGPFVPAAPAAALIRKLARGEMAARGARPCLGVVTLADIEAEWQRAGLRIATGWGEVDVDFRPALYRRALGSSYAGQSPAGQALHDAGPSCWTGRCLVEGGQTALGRQVARWFGLLRAAADAPIVVEFTAHDGGEMWTRRLGGRAMRSRQCIGVRRPPGWIVEQFGIFAFDLELQAAGGRLELSMRGMRCGGLPLPRFLWPSIRASESEEGGRFSFDVQIALPVIGRLVHYRGWLTRR